MKHNLVDKLQDGEWLSGTELDLLNFHYCKLSHCMFGDKLAHFSSRRVMFMPASFHKMIETGDGIGVMSATNHFNLFLDM